MPLQSSGAISLNEIHIEAGGSTGTTATINDADIRGLIDKTSEATMAFNEWYGASAVTPRGMFWGGYISASDANVDTTDYISIASTGNATDFGNLSTGRANVARGNCGSSTRGLTASGNGKGGAATNTLRGGYEDEVIEYFNFASTGNATDFGNLDDDYIDTAACSSSVRGIFSGGNTGSAYVNIVQYVEIASTGNTTDFGDLLAIVGQHSGGGGTTRGIFASGSSGDHNTIQYITIASTGNAIDFGDLRAGSRRGAAGSSNTRFVIAALDASFDDGDGVGYKAEAEYITIASTGNATDFGNLVSGEHDARAGTSNSIRMVIAGGASGITNEIEYLTIASTGDGIDFGDLTVARATLGSGSSEHGGL
tara:strand:+ start:7825 stop:8925 length:1101 start_codon:yes stop_codon:yes gene_type:complete